MQNAVLLLGRAFAFPVRLMAAGLSAIVTILVPRPVTGATAEHWTEPADRARSLFAYAEDNQLI